jgi:RNA polymerase sigma factor (sigma-70 family)
LNGTNWFAEQFETNRGHLRGVAYRMLGSLSEADDAVQETWIRLNRSDVSSVQNLRGWLTTVTARVCLDVLRARNARREEELSPQLSEVRGDMARWLDPEQEMIMADSIGLALLVILDSLTPTERIAFVLHDMFGVPFDEIANIVGRSEVAAKKLASRARLRIQGRRAVRGTNLGRQRRVVEAFLAASRAGDINALLEVLDPDVVRRADRSAVPASTEPEIRGAQVVARETLTNAGLARIARIAIVDGAAGLIVAVRRQLVAVLKFGIPGAKITEIEVISDPIGLRRIDLAPFRSDEN